MWTVDLVIDDNINNKIYKLKFDFPALNTYNDLYDDLDIIIKNTDYTKENIQFKLGTYRNEPLLIDDWDMYILNNDVVHVIILKSAVLYSLFTYRGFKLITSPDIKSMYNIINTYIKVVNIDGPLFLYCVNSSGHLLKLLDIILTNKLLYNKTTDRLIHDYYEKYNINI